MSSSRGTYTPPTTVITPQEPVTTYLDGPTIASYKPPEITAGTADGATGTKNFLKEYGLFIGISLLLFWQLKR